MQTVVEYLLGSVSHPLSLHPHAIVLGTTAIYLLLQRTLRFFRIKRMMTSYPYNNLESLASMTNDHAYEIQRDIFQLEFPYTAAKALGYALFRTYGIPSISKLLVQTRQLSDPANAGKRSADTGVLILEFLTSPPSSERANAAIARMNWQHSNYQKAGKISNDDLLYTLSLFALEPRKWIQRYEWRSLNEMEQCAFGVFWKSIGDAMKISYDGLPSARIGWKDGIHWLHEVEVWAEAYEKINMVPDLMNHKTANETTALFLYGLPTFMHKVGKQFVTAIMDDRLREAIMYPRSPWYSVAIVQAAFACRKLFLCYIALPRFTRLRTLSEDKDSKTGRYHMEVYNSEPWYVSDSFTHRWSLQAILRRLVGAPYPSKGYMPQGYIIQEIGPVNIIGKGLKECDEGTRRLMEADRGGCPFAVSKN